MIQIYDTTLRDGTQREGISLSCDDKLRIAQKLDELGVAFIEGGWPGSNPKDAEFFERAGPRKVTGRIDRHAAAVHLELHDRHDAALPGHCARRVAHAFDS